MIMFSLMLAALDEPAAVKQDAKCAAVMLVARDSMGSDARDESAAATAAAAYYVGKLEGYYATVPQIAFAPITPFERTRNAVIDADRAIKGFDEAKLLPVAKQCYQDYERTLAAL